MQAHRAPRWLPGGHAQTIWPALLSRRHLGPPPTFTRERWDTPDGDFIDLDWIDGPADAPLVVLFHGLEGSSASQYAVAFAAVVALVASASASRTRRSVTASMAVGACLVVAGIWLHIITPIQGLRRPTSAMLSTIDMTRMSFIAGPA